MTADTGVWVAAWTTSPVGPGAAPRPQSEGFDNQTIRMRLGSLSVGGRALRLRLSNLAGRQPVSFGAVTIAPAPEGPGASAGQSRPVLFGGRRAIALPPGADALSDAIPFVSAAQQELVVSLFSPRNTGAPTYAMRGLTSYVGAGNVTDSPAADVFTEVGPLGYYVTTVDVLTSADVRGTVVGFGDSITAQGWPGFLAQRVLGGDRSRVFSVVNAGIGGNRVLRNGLGDNALARMDRDVLMQSGIKAIIYLEGVNDIGFPHIGQSGTASAIASSGFDLGRPSAEDLIAGHQQVVTRAHARGLTIFGGILTPFKGAGYWTEDGEATRQALNAWIRDGGAYDGIVDFAAAVASPRDPLVLHEPYDSGDHLHPSVAGQQAMAACFDLDLFRNL